MKDSQLSEFEKTIDYTFQKVDLLAEALRHRSYVNEIAEPNIRDNECMEFLGDAVLNLVIGHLLMDRYPDLKEGDLSRMRAGLVNEKLLSTIARDLDLGKHLQLGKGEIQSNGQEKNSILADALEAVLAAVYLDSGFQSAFDVICNHFANKIESISAPAAHQDHKSRLQELVQSRHRMTPRYQVVHESGPDHDKTFRMQITVGELTVDGIGKSKKAAEQDAARKALEQLDNK